MYLFFDSLLMYLEHYELACTFVLSNGKSLKGIVVGRDQYMIYVETIEKQHFLFKSNVMDVIPSEKVDLKRVKVAVKSHLAKRKQTVSKV
ncbi:RNA chaperone Hfq [Bacillus toyonensis]|uniref:RNA chaperone Hfq n=1 Tax=Bacillus toyonensis TaxID=155322 RepID=UPI003D24EB8C